MPRPRLSRETLLPKLAAHVLVHGLADASLRPLAKAAGTSDRMLIYHFGSKDELIEALLEHLSSMFSAALESAFPNGRASSRADCIERVLSVTAEPAFLPFFRVWWDIVAGCARGNEAYLAAAGTMMEGLLQWVVDHLPKDEPDPEAAARFVLTHIEGSQMLTAVGRGDIPRAGLSAF